MKTNDNISRFRSIIISRIRDLRSDAALMERAAVGCRAIESTADLEEAADMVNAMLTDIVDHFLSYDAIEKEIERKHSKYLRNAVNRSRLAFLNTNNIEGKLSVILRRLSSGLDAADLYDDLPEDVCRIFNLFPQGFLSGASVKTVSVSRKITDVPEIYQPEPRSAAERQQRRQLLREKQQAHFSRRSIGQYVAGLLQEKSSVKASELPLVTRRDMVRVIFIRLYGKDRRSGYLTEPTNETISKNGFTFSDFIIKRSVK